MGCSETETDQCSLPRTFSCPRSQPRFCRFGCLWKGTLCIFTPLLSVAVFAQRYWLSTAPGLLPFLHSSYTDGETEAHSSKASSAGGRTQGQHSQGWQSQGPGPPSSPLAVSPVTVSVTLLGRCHCLQRVPNAHLGEPAGCESCRKSCEVGAGHFPGKAGLQPQQPFPCRLQPIIALPGTTAVHTLSPPGEGVCPQHVPPAELPLSHLWGDPRRSSWLEEEWWSQPWGHLCLLAHSSCTFPARTTLLCVTELIFF